MSNTPGSCVRAPEYVHDLSVSVTLGAPSPPPPQLAARMSTVSKIAPRPRSDIPCGTSHTSSDLVNSSGAECSVSVRAAPVGSCQRGHRRDGGRLGQRPYGLIP